MNARPSNKKAAILLQRGSERSYTVTVPKDSVILASYGIGSRPIISGFTTVTGWTKRSTTNVYVKYISRTTPINLLTINEVQYGLGREPEAGVYNTFETYSGDQITDNELTGSPDWDGAEAVVWVDQYGIDRCLITDHTTTTISYTNLGSGRDPDGTGFMRYFIQNDLRTLDTYGEWYYNVTTDSLYVMLDASGTTGRTIKVSETDFLLSNTGGHDYVTVKNIRFEGANKTAVKFTANTLNATVDNCEIQWTGESAVTVYGNNETFQNCAISNINGGNDDSETQAVAIYTKGTTATVTNNILDNIGVIPGQAYRAVYTIPITVNGTNSVISYNTVDSCAYMGTYATISASVVTINYNVVNDACQLLMDAGGIYIGHDHYGTVIDHNVVSNSGANGIYLDAYATGIKVTNNTVYGSYGKGIKLHMVKYDTIQNNTFYDNETNINFTDFVYTPTTTDTMNSNYLTGNLSVIGDSTQFAAEYTTTFTF